MHIKNNELINETAKNTLALNGTHYKLTAIQMVWYY